MSKKIVDPPAPTTAEFEAVVASLESVRNDLRSVRATNSELIATQKEVRSGILNFGLDNDWPIERVNELLEACGIPLVHPRYKAKLWVEVEVEFEAKTFLDETDEDCVADLIQNVSVAMDYMVEEYSVEVEVHDIRTEFIKRTDEEDV